MQIHAKILHPNIKIWNFGNDLLEICEGSVRCKIIAFDATARSKIQNSCMVFCFAFAPQLHHSETRGRNRCIAAWLRMQQSCISRDPFRRTELHHRERHNPIQLHAQLHALLFLGRNFPNSPVFFVQCSSESCWVCRTAVAHHEQLGKSCCTCDGSI